MNFYWDDWKNLLVSPSWIMEFQSHPSSTMHGEFLKIILMNYCPILKMSSVAESTLL